ncbi:MAG: hypothetical protein GWN13_24710, partial [Phycisphaerae bacterium]|nr:hypothetical protein [Phycisphaerae bacterium]
WFNPNTETLYVPILDTNSIDANDIDVNNLTIGTLTASRIVATDGSKKLVSISDFTLWVGGTSNRITVSNDGDGTITITTPQDTHTAA